MDGLKKIEAVPLVRVGIAEHSDFGIALNGEYNQSLCGEVRRLEPASPDCFADISNVTIGIGFHWQTRRTFRIHGDIDIVKHPDGSRTLINTIPIEDYLKSVISSEMSHCAPLEFLKAHAIISRSWVVSKCLHRDPAQTVGRQRIADAVIKWEDTSDHDIFDVCADDHCQRYQGIVHVDDRVEKAVSETSRQVLADSGGNIADARFSKCCGGHTELFSTCWQDCDYDYLPAKKDPYCDIPHEELAQTLSLILNDYDLPTTDFYRWTAKVDAVELQRKIIALTGRDIGCPVAITAEDRGPSGRIKLMRVEGEKGSVAIGKELTIRRLLSDGCLYSSAFDAEPCDGGFLLTGKGWGHGVGLCQIGAASMALQGFDYRQILQFYYPNTQIITI